MSLKEQIDGDIKKAMLQLLGDYKEETQTENIEN